MEHKLFYKKGIGWTKHEQCFLHTLSSSKLLFFEGSKSFKIYETENIDDFFLFCNDDKLVNLYLKDINQKDLERVIEYAKNEIELIDINYSNSIDASKIDFSGLSKCFKLKKIRINCFEGTINLWDIKDNKFLEELTIVGIKKLLNQEKLLNASVKKLTIRKIYYKMSDTKTPIINDFSLFESMDNLQELDLFIGKKKNKSEDLISLSRLKKIEKINLPKNYFTFNQFAWLNSKLPNAKGIGCIYECNWSKRIEKYVYSINGTRMAWEFKDYTGKDINKYLNKFDTLMKMYKDIDFPPEK